MNKRVRLGLRIGGILLIVFMLVGMALVIMVRLNKEPIITLARNQINKQVKGVVSIHDIELNFIRTFPNFSAQLNEVVIEDSLYSQHHHNILKAEKIFVRFNLFSLLRGKPRIARVIVENGSIYLYTDECGYCNLRRSEDVGFKKGKGGVPDFRFDHCRIVIDNQAQNSLHDIEVNQLICTFEELDSTTVFKVRMDAFMHSLSFNKDKGSYIREKTLEGNFYVLYSPGRKIEFNDLRLKIDHQPFLINGSFYFMNQPISYELTFQTKKIKYEKATSLLTTSLQNKLSPYEIRTPFDVTAIISGLTAPHFEPKINILLNVTDVDMATPSGLLSHCTFECHFSNQSDVKIMQGDENSKFTFTNVRTTWNDIEFTSQKTEITNLKSPYLICDVRSALELQQLNTLAESTSIKFLTGLGNLDITYNGPIKQIDTLHSLLNGTFTISNADVKYLPRNLTFSNCSGVLAFKDEDLIISNFTTTAGNTQLTMNGDVINLLALLYKNPEQLIMNWKISTPELKLDDFLTYVSEPQKISKPKTSVKNPVFTITENIDRMLSDGIANLSVSAGKLMYKKFSATDLNASVSMIGNRLQMNKVKLKHAGGAVNISGTLINGNHINKLTLTSNIENVNIPVILNAFDNFGQDAITHRNMKGRLSAKINVSGMLTDRAEVAENTMKGTVAFDVKDGELNNFEPALKIASTAFKNRDFSTIRFAELINQLDINGSAITIHKMEIRSNVVILFVEGIYDTKKGTDMSIQVPLSNLSKAENEVLENTGKVGVNIRLRAKTGEDGKLKVSWDPFNKASRQRKGEMKGDSLKAG